MAVEWLRSCYSSSWRLFRGSLRSVPGRFYFSPPGTPFFSGFHNLGSRTWYDGNWKHVQDLGEDLSAERSWNDGSLPAVRVKTDFLGSLSCINSGETIGEGLPNADLVNGFPSGCVADYTSDLATWEKGSDYSSCSVQLAGARIIDWSYGGNRTAIVDFLAEFLGPGWPITWHPPTVILPAVTIAINPAGALAWIDGTANYQQFALQAAYSLVGPQTVGPIGTSPFWSAAAEYILGRLSEAGVDATMPVFLCGHSYGGVAALIVAAKIRYAHPTRPIRYLTYGCPHIGDAEFVRLVGTCAGINLRNDSDIVTAVPPNSDTIYAIASFLGVDSLFAWFQWKKAPSGVMMDSNGAFLQDSEPVLDYPTLLGFAEDVLAALPYPTVEAHKITTYYSRILTRCPSPEWPVSQEDYDKLTATGFLLLESGDYVLIENGSRTLLESAL